MSSTPSHIRIQSVIPESVVDGPGIRYVIFAQGCPRRCEGCHNPQTHDFGGGEDVSTDKIMAEIREDPLLSGVTFSGGEPFSQAAPLAGIARQVHEMGLNVYVYTGYTLEQLVVLSRTDAGVAELLNEADTLIDGPYIAAERDLSLGNRGSRNQRVLDRADIKQALESQSEQ